MKVLVLYNSNSGSGDKEQLIDQLKTDLLAHGYLAEDIAIEEPSSIEEAVAMAKQASENHVDLVVTMGGDGTINKIAGGIYEGGAHSTLGILPSGTVNNFAKSLKLPQGKDAISVLREGVARPVELCRVNQSYAISSLTLGILADIAANVTADEKRKWGPLAYLKNAVKILTRNRNYYLELTHDGQTLRHKTKILLITLTNSVGGMDQFDPKAGLNDGLMSVYLLSDFSFWKMLLSLPRILRGEFGYLEGITHFRTGKMTIRQYKRTWRKARTRIDGDKSDQLPIVLEMIPQAIKVMVPNDQNR
ncbi:diacylglycerol/lipid kinase family protein [Streptococcus caprae]|uniref:Diacylglycerol/lipid kinase family protein n=1 Tax=Streptococcus caprae TaxID=1640501 RepID=A0ABV8CUM9_9STRE